MDSLEGQVMQHTQDIKTLTGNVSELAGLIQTAEKRRDEDRQDFKEMVKELRHLSDAVVETRSLEKSLNALTEEFRVTRHDLHNVMQAQQAMVILKDSVTKNELRIETIEKALTSANLSKMATDLTLLNTQRDQTVGSVRVIGIGAKILWSIFGGGLLYGAGFAGYYALKFYFEHS